MAMHDDSGPFVFGLMLLVCIAASIITGFHCYRIGQIDAISGERIVWEQITMSNGDMGWVHMNDPGKVRRITKAVHGDA